MATPYRRADHVRPETGAGCGKAARPDLREGEEQSSSLPRHWHSGRVSRSVSIASDLDEARRADNLPAPTVETGSA